MSRFLTITNSSSVNFGDRKRTIKKDQIKIGNVTLSFVLVLLLCIVGFYYIYEVNRMATKGFEIKQLEKELEELREGNEKLRIQEAELRSMYNIEEKTRQLNMTAPSNISYINLPGFVAMK